MNNLVEILITLPAIAIGMLLVLKPLPLMRFIGKIYWHLGKFTALGKSEETQKYFIGENPFWLRVLGTILLILSCLSMIARVGE